MRPYKGIVIGEIVIGCIKTKVRISDGGARHVDRINDLLEKMRGEVFIGMDVVNDGNELGEEKQNAPHF